MSTLLAGKVAVVTGSGHGIGRGHAIELARHGARVIVNDVGADGGADETVAIIRETGGEAVVDDGDVGDESAMAALIDRAVDTWGQLDVLVANAGTVRDRTIWNMTPEEFDAVIRVHIRGTWLPCHFAAIHWRTRAKAGEAVRGRIITTTSGAGLWGNFGQTNYATAKAAIVGMTLTMAAELYSAGVTVNAIGPSGATRLSAGVIGEEVVEPNDVPADGYHPMDPGLSAPLVAWLASDEAQHVTGQVLRSIHDKIFLMQGWREADVVSSDGKKWDATTLGGILARDVFHTRATWLQ
jgi:NAD(P)-dependent dehydrogenase (short-subunit alcohol dehydrogenase family)